MKRTQRPSIPGTVNESEEEETESYEDQSAGSESDDGASDGEATDASASEASGHTSLSESEFDAASTHGSVATDWDEEEGVVKAAAEEMKTDKLDQQFNVKHMDEGMNPYSQMSPEQLFEVFDLDNSGTIDFDEFENMLKCMGHTMSAAKALKYFRRIDTDNSGEIDLDEFKVALFTLDPITGNSLNFQPSALLGPRDAFELFDRDGSGTLDEMEFGNLMEYLGVELPEHRLEALFQKYDADGSGMIEYPEFKKAWVEAADARHELRLRGIEMSKYSTKGQLQKRLYEVLREEESHEDRALELAERWNEWRIQMREKERFLLVARERADEELANALDAAGQVYLFGVGAAKQFEAEPARIGVQGYEKLLDLWRRRVHPEIEEERYSHMVAERKTRKTLNSSAYYDTRLIGKNTGRSTKRTARAQRSNATSLSETAPTWNELKKSTKSLHAGKPKVYSSKRRRSGIARAVGFGNVGLSARSSTTRKGAVQPGNSSITYDSSAKDIRSPEYGYLEDMSGYAEELTHKMTMRRTVKLGGSNNKRKKSQRLEVEDWGRGGERRAWEIDPNDKSQKRKSPFAGLMVSDATMPLWGRRVVDVALAVNSGFALTETGEIFTWGGRTKWWTKPDGRVWDFRETKRENRLGEWGFKTTKQGRRLSLPAGGPVVEEAGSQEKHGDPYSDPPLTDRSNLLMGMIQDGVDTRIGKTLVRLGAAAGVGITQLPEVAPEVWENVLHQIATNTLNSTKFFRLLKDPSSGLRESVEMGARAGLLALEDDSNSVSTVSTNTMSTTSEGSNVGDLTARRRELIREQYRAMRKEKKKLKKSIRKEEKHKKKEQRNMQLLKISGKVGGNDSIDERQGVKLTTKQKRRLQKQKEEEEKLPEMPSAEWEEPGKAIANTLARAVTASRLDLTTASPAKNAVHTPAKSASSSAGKTSTTALLRTLTKKNVFKSFRKLDESGKVEVPPLHENWNTPLSKYEKYSRLEGVPDLKALEEAIAASAERQVDGSNTDGSDINLAVDSAVKLLGISAQEFVTLSTPRRRELEAKVKNQEKADALKRTAQYFNLWEPPPELVENATVFYEKAILPRIPVEDLKLALEIRGRSHASKNRTELAESLAEDLEVEEYVIGHERQREIRNIEKVIKEQERIGQKEKGEQLRQQIQALWVPLGREYKRFVERKKRQEMTERETMEKNLEEAYLVWRLKRKAAAHDMREITTPRGSAVIHLASTTTRGPKPPVWRGNMAAKGISAGYHHALLIHEATGDVYAWGSGTFGRLGMGDGPSGLEDGRGDRASPSLVPALKNSHVVQVSAAHSHSAAVTAAGKLYMWGSAVSGKLGLGANLPHQESYCPVPTPVAIPDYPEIRHVSCGPSHTGAVDRFGRLWMWGSGNNGRLGIPGTQWEPQLVKDFVHRREHIVGVACGGAHTLALTRLEERFEGEGEHLTRVITGGKVYMAGAQNSVGRALSKFAVAEELLGKPVIQVSAGFEYCGAVTQAGELYCWGMNRGGCCGQPPHVRILAAPTLVRCLYTEPINLCQLEDVVVQQSSVYNSLGPELAVNGSINGFGEHRCAHTQLDVCPYWEVDLGEQCVIDCVKVWNREDAPSDPRMDADEFTKRLFPMWVMVSQVPFPAKAGVKSLEESFRVSLVKQRFSKIDRCSTLHCKFGTIGRYVRIQVESRKFMHLAECQVWGKPSTKPVIGTVSKVVCGTDVTAAVIRRMPYEEELKRQYVKAVKADPGNADVLKNYDAYFTAYDAIGRGENIKTCPNCRFGRHCELCHIAKEWHFQAPKGPLGRARRLQSVTNLVLEEKPPRLEDVGETWPDEERRWPMFELKPKESGLLSKATNFLKKFSMRKKEGKNQEGESGSSMRRTPSKLKTAVKKLFSWSFRSKRSKREPTGPSEVHPLDFSINEEVLSRLSSPPASDRMQSPRTTKQQMGEALSRMMPIKEAPPPYPHEDEDYTPEPPRAALLKSIGGVTAGDGHIHGLTPRGKRGKLYAGRRRKAKKGENKVKLLPRKKTKRQ